jgi:hypothetical protein
VKTWVRRLLEILGWIPSTQIVAVVTPEYPEPSALPRGVLRIVGAEGYKKWAYLSCPCGCAAPIMLSLARKRRPRWRLTIDWLDRPTIQPSIRQTEG